MAIQPIQIKTADAGAEDQWVESKWKDSHVNFVVYFARNSNWGYVVPAFSTNRSKLNAEGHIKFADNQSEFLKAFQKID